MNNICNIYFTNIWLFKCVQLDTHSFVPDVLLCDHCLDPFSEPQACSPTVLYLGSLSQYFSYLQHIRHTSQVLSCYLIHGDFTCLKCCKGFMEPWVFQNELLSLSDDTWGPYSPVSNSLPWQVSRIFYGHLFICHLHTFVWYHKWSISIPEEANNFSWWMNAQREDLQLPQLIDYFSQSTPQTQPFWCYACLNIKLTYLNAIKPLKGKCSGKLKLNSVWI